MTEREKLGQQRSEEGAKHIGEEDESWWNPHVGEERRQESTNGEGGV